MSRITLMNGERRLISRKRLPRRLCFFAKVSIEFAHSARKLGRSVLINSPCAFALPKCRRWDRPSYVVRRCEGERERERERERKEGRGREDRRRHFFRLQTRDVDKDKVFPYPRRSELMIIRCRITTATSHKNITTRDSSFVIPARCARSPGFCIRGKKSRDSRGSRAALLVESETLPGKHLNGWRKRVRENKAIRARIFSKISDAPDTRTSRACSIYRNNDNKNTR